MSMVLEERRWYLPSLLGKGLRRVKQHPIPFALWLTLKPLEYNKPKIKINLSVFSNKF